MLDRRSTARRLRRRYGAARRDHAPGRRRLPAPHRRAGAPARRGRSPTSAPTGCASPRVGTRWRPGRSSQHQAAATSTRPTRARIRSRASQALDRAIARRAPPGSTCRSTSPSGHRAGRSRGPARSALRHRFKPDPQEFADFVAAVARALLGRLHRPGARHRPPAAGRAAVDDLERAELPVLPRAAVEEDAAAATGRTRRTCTGRCTSSPTRELKAVSASNDVLIGGLAATGWPTAGARRDPAARVPAHAGLREQDASRRCKVPECRGAGVLHADGFAMHPYSVGGSPGRPRRSARRRLPRRPRPARRCCCHSSTTRAAPTASGRST